MLMNGNAGSATAPIESAEVGTPATSSGLYGDAQTARASAPVYRKRCCGVPREQPCEHTASRNVRGVFAEPIMCDPASQWTAA